MRSASPLVALVVLVGLTLVSAAGLLVAPFRGEEPSAGSAWGVRLGMSATELRARVEQRGPGTWTTRLESGDWVLERDTDREHAAFALHDGRVVAIRIEGPASAELDPTPSYEETAESVRIRARRGERVEITILSRTCPTHHDEAERLVAEHARQPSP